MLDAVRSSPKLEGALCAGKWLIWESEDQATADYAVSQCNICPALDRCADWADGYGTRGLLGVVAGKVRAYSDRGYVNRGGGHGVRVHHPGKA
jgi:hypothetical protein